MKNPGLVRVLPIALGIALSGPAAVRSHGLPPVLSRLATLPPGTVIFSGGASGPPTITTVRPGPVDALEQALVRLAETSFTLPDARPFQGYVSEAIGAYLPGLRTPTERRRFLDRLRTVPAVCSTIAELAPPQRVLEWLLAGSKTPSEPETTRDSVASVLMDLEEAVLAKLSAGALLPAGLPERCADALIATLALPAHPFERRRLVDQLLSHPEIKRALAGREAQIDDYLQNGIVTPARTASGRVPVWEDLLLARIESALAGKGPHAGADDGQGELTRYARGLKTALDREGFLGKAQQYPLLRARFIDPCRAAISRWINAGAR